MQNWQFRMVKINKSTHHFHTDIAASAHATTLKERYVPWRWRHALPTFTLTPVVLPG